MIVYQVVGTVTRSWWFAVRCLQYGRVREPFFVLAGAQLGVLILLGQFHAEWLAGALTPVVSTLGGEAATHYPEHFWLLPELYRNANVLVMILFGVFAHAAAIAGFAARADRWAPAFQRAGALVPLGLLNFGTAWAITSAFDLIPQEIVFYSSIVRLGFQGIDIGQAYSTTAWGAILAPFFVGLVADRYFARALEGYRQISRALRYVLLNGRKHGVWTELSPDPFSSARWFRWFRSTTDNMCRPLRSPPVASRNESDLNYEMALICKVSLNHVPGASPT